MHFDPRTQQALRAVGLDQDELSPGETINARVRFAHEKAALQ